MVTALHRVPPPQRRSPAPNIYSAVPVLRYIYIPNVNKLAGTSK